MPFQQETLVRFRSLHRHIVRVLLALLHVAHKGRGRVAPFGLPGHGEFGARFDLQHAVFHNISLCRYQIVDHRSLFAKGDRCLVSVRRRGRGDHRLFLRRLFAIVVHISRLVRVVCLTVGCRCGRFDR